MHEFIALAPVVMFLAVLWFMDSFRLVRPSSIVVALIYGAGAAFSCEALHGWLLPATGFEPLTFSRYVAPITEEIAKAAFIGLLIARGRVGFLVDAAVQGFAIGTGFALVENATYLRALPSHFEGAVVADMFCLLRIELELAVQAKAWLIAHQAGLDLPVDDDLRAALAERAYLERSIGRTGMLALEPLRVTSHRDHWHRHMLAQPRL